MLSDDFSSYDFISQPVFVLKPDANNHPIYHFLNTVALGYLGRPMGELRDLPAYEIFSGRAAYAVYRHQCMAWAKGVAAEYEIALPIKDRVYWVRTHLAPIKDSTGRMTHMVGTSQDVSEIRAALQVHAMDAAMAQEMEDLVCFAAHDLRTPVGNLKSLAELMRHEFVDHGDGKVQLIDMIDAISDKALSVVGTIMNQAMGNCTRSSQDPFDFGAVCDDIVIMLDPTRAHSIAYPRMHLRADSTAIHIILRNLVDNALKHCGKSAAQVTIDVSQINVERLLFVIRDDGTGFSDDALTKQNLATEKESSGFGLGGIMRLVRARGGHLTVMPPSDGPGAEIHFELPGKILDTAAEEEPPLLRA